QGRYSYRSFHLKTSSGPRYCGVEFVRPRAASIISWASLTSPLAGVTDMRALLREIGRYPLYFLLFYWICFTFPFPLDLFVLPFQLVDQKDQPACMKAAADSIGKAYSLINDKKGEACTRVGERVLHVQVVLQPTGSGDTMRAYVGCFCAAIIAAAAAF